MIRKYAFYSHDVKMQLHRCLTEKKLCESFNFIGLFSGFDSYQRLKYAALFQQKNGLAEREIVSFRRETRL